MPRKKIDFDVVRELALGLPSVEASTIRGAPSLKVRGKLFCCAALHRSADPGTLALRIDRSERAKLIEANPRVYYVTDHYLNFSTVLVRLAQIDRPALKKLLAIAWKFATNAETPRTRASQPSPRRTRRRRRTAAGAENVRPRPHES